MTGARRRRAPRSGLWLFALAAAGRPAAAQPADAGGGGGSGWRGLRVTPVYHLEGSGVAGSAGGAPGPGPAQEAVVQE